MFGWLVNCANVLTPQYNLIYKHPVCYYIYLFGFYLTFNARISISKIQITLFMATCLDNKYHLQAMNFHFKN
jgi:hypothetical protein